MVLENIHKFDVTNIIHLFLFIVSNKNCYDRLVNYAFNHMNFSIISVLHGEVSLFHISETTKKETNFIMKEYRECFMRKRISLFHYSKIVSIKKYHHCVP